MAEGLEEGALIHTLEINDEMEDFIMKYLKQSPHQDKIRVHFGDALDIIPALGETFDLVLSMPTSGCIRNTSTLFPDGACRRLDSCRQHVVDGHVVEEHPKDKQTLGILSFNDKIKEDPRIEKVILPLRDGLTMIWKK